jgi:hypothetical protein
VEFVVTIIRGREAEKSMGWYATEEEAIEACHNEGIGDRDINSWPQDDERRRAFIASGVPRARSAG